ncbi:MAG: CHAT domain-containing protein [Bacteroidetes bacterium]|jgi:CHAT domain-containing protein/uncharacterized protein HemY|nr:CHAT domain-containing protein [Bacteroidota bacterium]
MLVTIALVLVAACTSSLDDRVDRARSLHAAGRFGEAAGQITPLLEQQDLPDSLRLLGGRILHDHGDLRQARDVLAPLAASPSPYRDEARWLLAHTHFLLGHPDSARAHSQALLRSAKDANDTLDRSRAHHVLGLTAFYEADYDAAERHQRASLRWARSARDVKAEADALRQLGVLAWYSGAIDSAQTVYYEPALRRYRQVGDRIGEATTLSNIGLLYWERRDAEPLARYQIEAFDLRRQMGDQVGLADSYYFLATVPEIAGLRTPVYKYDYLKKSADLSERIGYAWGLQIARRQLRWHVMRTLEADLPRRLPWSEDTFAPSGEERLLAVYTAAHRAEQQEDWTAALDLFERASAMADSLDYINYRISTRSRRVGMLIRLGRLDAAEKLLAEAAALRRHDPTYASDRDGDMMRALLHLRQGRRDDAVTVLEPLTAHYDSLYLAMLSSSHPGQHVERAAGAVHGRRSSTYGALVELLHPTQPEDAFRLLERERRLPFWGTPTEATGQERAALSRFVALLEAHGGDASRRVDTKAILTALGEMQQAMLAEQHTLQSVAPTAQMLEVTSVPKVQETLRAGEVLVEYMVNADSLTLCVLRPDTLAWLTVPVGREAMETTVRMLRRTVMRGAQHPADTLWQPSARRLYDWLIAPLQEGQLLQEGDHLIISPHRVLYEVPFAALIAPTRTGQRRVLVEQHALSFVPSASFLVDQRQRSMPDRTTWVGIAPAGDGLPHAEREVRLIASQWEGTARMHLGRAATAGVTLDALREADVVHIAAHARMNTRFPLYAHVALHDRRLELHELMHHRIDASLVVLSACETGQTAGTYEATPTSADRVSFPRALLTAGARSVMATRWPVEDATTATLMGAVYADLQRRRNPPAPLRSVRTTAPRSPSLAEALAHAQRQYLRGRAEDGAPAHPFYWGAVSLYGDGR